jgi:UDP-N-acetylmuramoyl-L-alanyl-D-glutamate-L-lysine ligase
MYGITLGQARDLLEQAGLLRGLVFNGSRRGDVPGTLAERHFTRLSCDSREADADTLFFVKGANFRREYLDAALGAGLRFYAAERVFAPEHNALLVSDTREALALTAAAFYGHPRRRLTLAAFTGTKGKTTAVYFTHHILKRAAAGKAAMISTIDTTLDGRRYFKSALTTPESLDLHRMMAEAADNGMTHLVMEVSSQAYKTGRVAGLDFDAGVFLNITPDHIGPSEHSSFEDYFSCKRQLFSHARAAALNRETARFDELAAQARAAGASLYVYGASPAGTHLFVEDAESAGAGAFTVRRGELAGLEELAGGYETLLEGGFNRGNALAAAIAAYLCGAKKDDITRGIAETRVPGRMEKLACKNGAAVYVDYAHNGASLEALLGAARASRKGRIIVALGSTGNKGQSRRKDLGAVLARMADTAILTEDDPAFEDPLAIAEEIRAAIGGAVETRVVIPREEAIRLALSLAENERDAVVIAGKGADRFQIVKGEKVPYEGDFAVAERIINQQ